LSIQINHVSIRSRGVVLFLVYAREAREIKVPIFLLTKKVQLDISEVLSDGDVNSTDAIDVLIGAVGAILVKEPDHGEVLGGHREVHRGVHARVLRVRVRLVLQQQTRVVIVVRQYCEVERRCLVLLVAYLVRVFITTVQ